MARKAPAFQFYADDFLAGTISMSNEEVGCYIRLLCMQWSHGVITERHLRSLAASKEVTDYVIKEKFTPVTGGFQNTRLESVRSNSQSRAEAGKQGGKHSLRGSGCAYGVVRAIDGAIKLGCSKNPHARRAQIATREGCAVKLVAIWECDDMEVAESVLQGFFASKRLKGEWFSIKLSDLDDTTLAQNLRNVNCKRRAIDTANKPQTQPQTHAQIMAPPTPSPSPSPLPVSNSHSDSVSLSVSGPAGQRDSKPRHVAEAPPSVAEVRQCMADAGLTDDAERFVAFYTANGWKQGRGKPIFDWRAAARLWRADSAGASTPVTFARQREANTKAAVNEFVNGSPSDGCE